MQLVVANLLILADLNRVREDVLIKDHELVLLDAIPYSTWHESRKPLLEQDGEGGVHDDMVLPIP